MTLLFLHNGWRPAVGFALGEWAFFYYFVCDSIPIPCSVNSISGMTVTGDWSGVFSRIGKQTVDLAHWAHFPRRSALTIRKRKGAADMYNPHCNGTLY